MNISRHEQDLDDLIKEGQNLYYAILFSEMPEESDKLKAKSSDKQKWDSFVKGLPNFNESYQPWYSESLEVISQLLPSRMEDFVDYYKPPKTRKEITNSNYTISDYLQGITITLGVVEQVSMKAAIPKFRQQQKILESLKNKFTSSLFDIKALVQADVFDNELDVASELVSKGFNRAAGAIAGVVLEGHLSDVCSSHQIKITKPKPTISDFNDALKKAGIIDIPTWRRVQLLADIRNQCDHKGKEPSKDDIDDLITGVGKIIKTLF